MPTTTAATSVPSDLLFGAEIQVKASQVHSSLQPELTLPSDLGISWVAYSSVLTLDPSHFPRNLICFFGIEIMSTMH